MAPLDGSTVPGRRHPGSLASPTDLVEDQRAEGVATTSVVARTLLADEYVDFLRSGVNTAITAAFAVLG